MFCAVSLDGGRTFAAPVRVNAVAGEARISGEIAPRVSIVPSAAGAAAEIVVAWNAKDGGTQVKLARSRDGGRSVLPPVPLQAADAAGDRGWQALTLDARARRM